LKKIGHQDIDDNNINFIMSLPDNELKKLCERITNIEENFRFSAWMIRNTHNEEEAVPDIKEIIKKLKIWTLY